MSMMFVLASLLIAPVADDIKLDLKAGKFNPDGNELLGYNEGDECAFFYINGSVTLTAKVPAEGEYTIVLSAACTAAMKENAKITIHVGDKEVAKGFALTTEDQKDYTFTAKFKDGENKLKIEFINDTYKEGEYDLNFYLHSVTLKKK